MKKARPYIVTISIILAFVGAVFLLRAIETKHYERSATAAVSNAELIEFTNNERAERDLDLLATSTLLSQAAQEKAEDMAKREYFAHYTPEGDAPWYWLKQVSYAYTHAGENLAVNFRDSKDVVEAWMDSPTHRANILKNGYDEIGVGYAEGKYKGHDAIYVVQFFGTQSTSTAFSTVGAGAGEGFAGVLDKVRSIYISFMYGVENSSTHWDNPDLP
ncbi:MAG: hypothetical protein RLY57_218 [Candidatus Parcubacteria bacterium]|jgi:uncharacterized protein YkwD